MVNAWDNKSRQLIERNCRVNGIMSEPTRNLETYYGIKTLMIKRSIKIDN